MLFCEFSDQVFRNINKLNQYQCNITFELSEPGHVWTVVQRVMRVRLCIWPYVSA